MKQPNKRQLVAISSLALSSMLLPTTASACSTDVYLGTLCLFGGNFTIRGYASAQGQLLPISQNTALFSLFGTTYGGDGRTTFALPDLRGRSPIGQGTGPGLDTIRLGQRGGSPTHTLSVLEMPSHNHAASTTIVNNVDSSASSATLRALAANADTNVPTGSVLANSPRRENIYNSGTPNVDMSADAIVLDVQVSVSSNATTTVLPAGGSVPFNIRSPYLGMNWLVATQGIFPSRS